MTERPDPWRELSIKRDALTLTLLPGIGGRLWDVALGGRSFLFQNPDLLGQPFRADSLASLPTRSPQFGFPLWGGEKTWVAPDRDWPAGAPYPALDAGAYHIATHSPEAVSLVSPVCPISQLRITRTITLRSGSAFSIAHSLRNCGSAPRRCGIWSVMMLDHPARIAVPGPHPDIRPVFDRHDGRAKSCADGLTCTCQNPHQFKIATANPTGRTLIRNPSHDISILCTTGPSAPGDSYAHGLPFEIFNSGDYAYCEAEWHAPARDLAPQAELRFTQNFRIWRGAPPGDLALTRQEKELLTCMSS